MPSELLQTNTIQKSSFDIVNERGDAISVSDLPPGTRKIVFDKNEVVKAKEESRELSSQDTIKGKEIVETMDGIVEEKAQQEKKQQVLLAKKVEVLTTIESIREDLKNMDSYPGELNIEVTNAIAREKLKVQDALTGMKQQTAEIQATQKDLEAHTPVSIDFVEKTKVLDESISDSTQNVEHQLPHTNEEEQASKVNTVTNEIILGQQKIETKEALPFDMKKIYGALENMLTVFDARARKLSGFDIMTQRSFDTFASLYQFMNEKIIGPTPDKESGKLDFTTSSDLNNELVEKFENAMDTLEITPTERWQGLGSQQEYAEDLTKIRDALGYMNQELAPFAAELKNSTAYTSAGNHMETASQKTYKLAEMFNEKAQTYANYIG